MLQCVKKRISKIAKKLLYQPLTELKNNNMVSRRVYSEKPVKVIYSIIEKDKSLKEIFRILEEWGLKHEKNTMSNPILQAQYQLLHLYDPE